MKKEEKKWAVTMLFLGLFLGVFGNLAANALDRFFLPEFGYKYDIAVGVVFLAALFYFDRRFSKLLDL